MNWLLDGPSHSQKRTGRVGDNFQRTTCLLLATFYVQQADSYAFFRDSIPNGDKVPHPCNPLNSNWDGVGHLVAAGGGDRNPFGIDFKLAGTTWTTELCNKDSDGDGQTNGQELGDPDCVWVKDAGPPAGEAVSHPGFCEPIGSDKCTGRITLNCSRNEKFTCAAINEAETFPMPVRIRETAVPAKETTYTCMMFDFPDDRDYHLVALLEEIDNIDVMHHIVIYGCGRGARERPRNEPYNCFMSGGDNCETFIGAWSLGQNGFCYHPAAGVKVGPNGWKSAVMELHWNNPKKTTGYTDSSGVTFYLTPTLRQFDAGFMYIGQSYLAIPPQEQMYSEKATCSPACTSKLMRGPINITSAFNHMHYLGKKVITEVEHAGPRLEYLAKDDVYDYDRPVLHSYDVPIQVFPGDKLEIECTFNSMSRTKTTRWGFDTGAEMCYSFITYYPAENFIKNSCQSVQALDVCEVNQDVIRGCDTTELFDPNNPETRQMYMDLEKNCDAHYCREECKAVVLEIKDHVCFEEELLRYFNTFYKSATLQRFYALLSSCDAEIYKDGLDDSDDTDDNGGGGNNGGTEDNGGSGNTGTDDNGGTGSNIGTGNNDEINGAGRDVIPVWVKASGALLVVVFNLI